MDYCPGSPHGGDVVVCAAVDNDTFLFKEGPLAVESRSNHDLYLSESGVLPVWK